MKKSQEASQSENDEWLCWNGGLGQPDEFADFSQRYLSQSSPALALLHELEELNINARLIVRTDAQYPALKVPYFSFDMPLERVAFLTRMVSMHTELFNYWSISGVISADTYIWSLQTAYLRKLLKCKFSDRSAYDFYLLSVIFRNVLKADLEIMRRHLIMNLSGQ